MITFALPALMFLSLAAGVFIGFHAAHLHQCIEVQIADAERAAMVDDAADMAIDGEAMDA